jgi:hypothetical protein
LIFSVAWSVPGQIAMRNLCHRSAWRNQTFLWVMTVFWSFYAIVAAAFTIFFIKRVKSLRWQIEQEPGFAENSGIPLTVRSTFVVVLGIYVASFSWLIFLALRAHDQLSAAVTAGLMTLLFAWHFLKARKRTGAASLQGSTGHVALAWAIILVILNLRLQVWLATLLDLDPAALHRLLPAWVVPSATLFLVLVVGMATALSGSQRPLASLEDAKDTRSPQTPSATHT